MPRSLQSARISAETMTHEEIAALAHDLRTPLGGIDAMIDLLARSPLSEEQSRLVFALQSAAAHLRGLANKVLGNPQGDSPSLGFFDGREALPQLEAACAYQPINPLLESLCISAQARAKARGLTFRLSLIPSDWQAYTVDAEPLRRVLENLIDNAMRLTQQGEVCLEVALDAKRARLLFRVIDTGPGLTQAEASALIHSGGHIQGRAGGAGMGLRLSATLVANAGGVLIGGMRQDGQIGAEFTFDWPHAQKTEAAPALPCLIVDDHASGRLILKTILGAMGVVCEEVADGEAAWQKLSSRPYRAVFTDLQMPNGGGDALLSRIAQMPPEQQPLVVVVSAAQDLPSGIHRNNLAAVVQKPISVAALAAVVERFDLGSS